MPEQTEAERAEAAGAEVREILVTLPVRMTAEHVGPVLLTLVQRRMAAQAGAARLRKAVVDVPEWNTPETVIRAPSWRCFFCGGHMPDSPAFHLAGCEVDGTHGHADGCVKSGGVDADA